MHPTVLSGAAALLLFALWWAGRRRPPALLRSTDASAIAALNRAQIAAVQRPDPPAVPQPPAQGERPALATTPSVPPPLSSLPPSVLLQHLSLAFKDPGTRLAALRQARSWGHRGTVPLLLRGLRDSDPAVVREAALAMERFRGRPVASGRDQPSAVLPPRNVARTR